MLSLSVTNKKNELRKIFCTATIFAMLFAISACATPFSHGNGQWAAHGYLTPGPTSEPELIGVYVSKAECEAAATTWMSRQVVGNPIFADCYPVDRN